MQDEIIKRIKSSFGEESEVKVEDPRGSGDYFNVSVKSSFFNNKSRIEQHRLVNALFKEELDSGKIHALSIKTNTDEG